MLNTIKFLSVKTTGIFWVYIIFIARVFVFTSGNAFADENVPQDTFEVSLNPMMELDFLKKEEIFSLRKKFVFQYPELAAKDYAPSEKVFGSLEDGLPWWGILGRSFYGDGQQSIKGVSLESLFITNPYLFVGLDNEVAIKVVGPDPWIRPEEVYAKPVKLVWAKNRAWAKVIYDVSSFWVLERKYGVQNSYINTLGLHAANARDLGFNYLYVVEEKSENIESLNPTGEALAIPYLYHKGNSCGYAGGCNNISPNAPDFRVRINVLPAVIYIKLWKFKPAKTGWPADMTFIIQAR
jgi:hypothetical protein